MRHFATFAACWVGLFLIIWPMFIAAGRADDAMERYARSRGLNHD